MRHEGSVWLQTAAPARPRRLHAGTRLQPANSLDSLLPWSARLMPDDARAHSYTLCSSCTRILCSLQQLHYMPDDARAPSVSSVVCRV
jgi:hypothetical protein